MCNRGSEEIVIKSKASSIIIFSRYYFTTMRTQIVRYIINVLLCGLLTRYNHQANGFGFNFTPAVPPSIPLQVAANSPFPFGPPACGAAPFCPPPTIVLGGPSFAPQAPFFPPPYPPSYPPPYPPPYPYPYPPPPFPYPYPQSDPYPKHPLFATILDSLLLKKGQSMSPPPPPMMPMMKYPPQHSRIQLHLVKDSGQDHKKQNHHQNHWREEKPKWN